MERECIRRTKGRRIRIQDNRRIPSRDKERIQ